jgi:hypothetical protein
MGVVYVLGERRLLLAVAVAVAVVGGENTNQ